MLQSPILNPHIVFIFCLRPRCTNFNNKCGIHGGKLLFYILFFPSFLSAHGSSTLCGSGSIIRHLVFGSVHKSQGKIMKIQIIIHTTNNSETSYMERPCLSQAVPDKRQSKKGWGPRVKNHRRTISSSIKEATSHFGSKRRGKQQLCFLMWYQKSLTTDILFLWHF